MFFAASSFLQFRQLQLSNLGGNCAVFMRLTPHLTLTVDELTPQTCASCVRRCHVTQAEPVTSLEGPRTISIIIIIYFVEIDRFAKKQIASALKRNTNSVMYLIAS